MKKLIVHSPVVSVCEECAGLLWPGRDFARLAVDPPLEEPQLSWDSRYRLGPVCAYPGTQYCPLCAQNRTGVRWIVTDPL